MAGGGSEVGSAVIAAEETSGTRVGTGIRSFCVSETDCAERVSDTGMAALFGAAASIRQKAAARMAAEANRGDCGGKIFFHKIRTGRRGNARMPIHSPRKPVTENRPYTMKVAKQNSENSQSSRFLSFCTMNDLPPFFVYCFNHTAERCENQSTFSTKFELSAWQIFLVEKRQKEKPWNLTIPRHFTWS